MERIDRLQQRHGTLGFAYAVLRKYADDGGGREAALITYYGFLSIFPTLLLAGAGVVSGAYQTLNHLAAVRYRRRAGFVSRYLRTLLGLIVVVTAAVGVGGLTVVTAALPGLPWASRVAAMLGSCLVAFGVLLLVARLLLDRPAPFRGLWPAAAPGAVAVTLNLGAVVLPGLVRRAGPVYGGFATVTGMFTMLYLLSVALVYAAEIAAVRDARLWPRAIDRACPTAADARALALLAREQERIDSARVELRLLRRPR